MAFTLSFLIYQGIDPSSFLLTDTSTGSDVNVVTRRVVVTTADGTYLVPQGTTTNYTPFPFSDGASITLYVLDMDESVSVNLQYVDINGTVLYSLSQNYTFARYDKQFDYSLTQQLVAQQSLLQDANYVTNRFTLRMLIEAATEAVTTGNDINSGQFLLDLAQVFVDNQNVHF